MVDIVYPKKGKFRDEAVVEHREYISSEVLHEAEFGCDKEVSFILTEGNAHY